MRWQPTGGRNTAAGRGTRENGLGADGIDHPRIWARQQRTARVIHSISQLYYHSEKTDFHVENNGRQRLVPRDRALSAFWEVVCRK